MKSALRILGIVVGVALLIYVYQRCDESAEAKLVKWRADSTRIAEDARVKAELAAAAGAKLDTTILTYTVYRDRILGSGTATPRDSATFRTCDAVVADCQAKRLADSVAYAAKVRELEHQYERPTERAPRFQIYGEGLYDFLNAGPVIRAGAELRLVGEIRAVAAGDLALPPAQRAQLRGLVGIRYTF